MTGAEFRQFLLQKWGKSYDVRLQRRRDRVLLLVMWKFLEQQSFPLSEADYLEHLELVLERLSDWGVLESALQDIQTTRQKPRLGKAVTIPLDLGERASEWLL
jgi:hypothetical protein